MNDVYFACTECMNYVDAGYRWAYWQLENPRVVVRGGVVEVDRLLSVDAYWKPEPNEHNSWLASVLSDAKQFVLRHEPHRIVYGDLEQLMGADVDEYVRFGWMNEYPADDAYLQPRNFFEQLGMRTWGEVAAYLSSRSSKPRWYDWPRARVAARRKFDELVLSELHHSGHPQRS